MIAFAVQICSVPSTMRITNVVKALCIELAAFKVKVKVKRNAIKHITA